MLTQERFPEVYAPKVFVSKYFRYGKEQTTYTTFFPCEKRDPGEHQPNLLLSFSGKT